MMSRKFGADERFHPSATPTPDMVAVREAELRMHPQYFDDVTVVWLYRPHNITLMVLVVLYVFYKAFFRPETSIEQNIFAGLFACLALLLPISIVAFPNGPFCRPHPAIWRMVTGCQVAYFFVMVFLLFQNRDDARQFLKVLDSSLGVPLEPKGYGDACALTVPNVLSVVNDVFFYAHLVGWIVKAMLLRSYAVCWTLSILWELAEMSLIPWLPNFIECWWDSWIIDVILCNGVGIYIGMRICRYLEYKNYDWQGFTRIPSASGKFQRAVLQFTPFSWTKVKWEITSSVKHFVVLVGLGASMILNEMNGFFLKDILWVPSDHVLTLGRLVLWTLMGAPALREFYLYFTDDTCKRLGFNCWLAGVTLIVELAVALKFGKGMFPRQISPLVPLAWVVGIVVFMGAMIEYILWNNYRASRRKVDPSADGGTEEGEKGAEELEPPEPAEAAKAEGKHPQVRVERGAVRRSRRLRT